MAQQFVEISQSEEPMLVEVLSHTTNDTPLHLPWTSTSHNNFRSPTSDSDASFMTSPLEPAMYNTGPVTPGIDQSSVSLWHTFPSGLSSQTGSLQSIDRHTLASAPIPYSPLHCSSQYHPQMLEICSDAHISATTQPESLNMEADTTVAGRPLTSSLPHLKIPLEKYPEQPSLVSAYTPSPNTGSTCSSIPLSDYEVGTLYNPESSSELQHNFRFSMNNDSIGATALVFAAVEDLKKEYLGDMNAVPLYASTDAQHDLSCRIREKTNLSPSEPHSIHHSGSISPFDSTVSDMEMGVRMLKLTSNVFDVKPDPDDIEAYVPEYHDQYDAGCGDSLDNRSPNNSDWAFLMPSESACFQSFQPDYPVCVDPVIPDAVKTAARGATFMKPTVAGPALRDSAINRRKTGAKFLCSWCGATFTAKHNLKNHYNSHLGVRKHVCEDCGKPFGTSHVLTRHKKTFDLSAPHHPAIHSSLQT